MLNCSVMSSYFETPWTIALHAPLYMGFSEQEYWRGLPWNLPDPGIKPASPALAGRFFTPEPPGKPRQNDSIKVSLKTMVEGV